MTNGTLNSSVEVSALFGALADPIARNREINALEAFTRAVENAYSMPAWSLRSTGKGLDRRRDVEEECGYPRIGEAIPDEYYRWLWERDSIAARVVEVLPKESWNTQPLVYESDDPACPTAFDEAFSNMVRDLRGEQSWFADDEGNPLWEALMQVDVLSGIGRYGVLFIGFDDGMPLDQPVKGIAETGSFPVEYDKEDKERKNPKFPNKNPSELLKNGTLPVYNLKAAEFVDETEEEEPEEGVPVMEAPKRRRILFLRALPDYLAPIVRWETNPFSRRFGQPLMYEITFEDPREAWGSIGSVPATGSHKVHWTRVLHVVDHHHQAGTSKNFGVPRMRCVLNNLLGLHKLYAADPEMFWNAGVPLPFFETHPQLGGDVIVNESRMKDKWEMARNALDRLMVAKGGTFKNLAPGVADPTPHIKAQLEAICIKLGVPMRIFMGSERGELSSAQDDSTAKERNRSRQNAHNTPNLVVGFTDRAVLTGVLPVPKGVPDKAKGEDLPDEIEDETETDEGEGDEGGEVENAFCPTGEGGGIDPTCSPGAAGTFESTGGSFRKVGDHIEASHPLTGAGSDYEKPNVKIRDARKYGRGFEVFTSDYVSNPKAGASSGGLSRQETVHATEKSLKEAKIAAAKKVMEIIGNTFCPTGEGGGVDPTCSHGGGDNPESGKAKFKSLNDLSKRIREASFEDVDSAVESAFANLGAGDAKKLATKHGGFGAKSKKQAMEEVRRAFKDRISALTRTSYGSEGKSYYSTNRRRIVKNGKVLIVNAKNEVVGVQAKAGYSVEWPDLTSGTEQEKSALLTARTQAMATYVSGDVASLMPPLDFLTREMGFDEEEAQAILEAAEAHQEEAIVQQQAELDKKEVQLDMAGKGFPPSEDEEGAGIQPQEA